MTEWLSQSQPFIIILACFLLSLDLDVPTIENGKQLESLQPSSSVVNVGHFSLLLLLCLIIAAMN